jgi:hypothetical protein
LLNSADQLPVAEENIEIKASKHHLERNRESPIKEESKEENNAKHSRVRYLFENEDINQDNI